MSGSFINRIFRAAKLDVSLYEEVETDKTAMRQAMLVVILSGLAYGVGSFSRGGTLGVVLGAFMGLVGWYIWAFTIFFIGTKLLPEPQTRSNVEKLLRIIGFASAPGLIRIFGIIFGIIPVIQITVFSIAAVWMFVAMVTAVKEALDYKTIWRAVIVCVISYGVQAAIIRTIILLLQILNILPKPA